MVNNVTDLSKFKRGKMVLAQETFSLDELWLASDLPVGEGGSPSRCCARLSELHVVHCD